MSPLILLALFIHGVNFAKPLMGLISQISLRPQNLGGCAVRPHAWGVFANRGFKRFEPIPPANGVFSQTGEIPYLAAFMGLVFANKALRRIERLRQKKNPPHGRVWSVRAAVSPLQQRRACRLCQSRLLHCLAGVGFARQWRHRPGLLGALGKSLAASAAQRPRSHAGCKFHQNVCPVR